MTLVHSAKVGQVSIPRQRTTSDSLRKICIEEFYKPNPGSVFYVTETDLLFRGLCFGLFFSLIIDTAVLALVIYLFS